MWGRRLRGQPAAPRGPLGLHRFVITHLFGILIPSIRMYYLNYILKDSDSIVRFCPCVQVECIWVCFSGENFGSPVRWCWLTLGVWKCGGNSLNFSLEKHQTLNNQWREVIFLRIYVSGWSIRRELSVAPAYADGFQHSVLVSLGVCF